MDDIAYDARPIEERFREDAADWISRGLDINLLLIAFVGVIAERGEYLPEEAAEQLSAVLREYYRIVDELTEREDE